VPIVTTICQNAKTGKKAVEETRLWQLTSSARDYRQTKARPKMTARMINPTISVIKLGWYVWTGANRDPVIRSNQFRRRFNVFIHQYLVTSYLKSQTKNRHLWRFFGFLDRLHILLQHIKRALFCSVRPLTIQLRSSMCSGNLPRLSAPVWGQRAITSSGNWLLVTG